MFDPETVSLINEAPPLEGLENGRLSQILTEAYAEIVSSRIRMRELQEDADADIELPIIIEKLRRLAFTQEALVASSVERENRIAAAFVAASAHHACLLADSLLTNRLNMSALTYEGISADVSATVLFLMAEASTDAAEVAKLIQLEEKEGIEQKLLYAIQLFATGKLTALIRIELLSSAQIIGEGGQNAATRALYHKILEALVKSAATMLGVELEFPLSELDPIECLQQVQELCVEPTAYDVPYGGHIHKSIYPGPLHLSTLLEGTLRGFLDSGVVNVPPPDGVDELLWVDLMRSFAEKRPFLWRNHRQALTNGYLDIGTSAVVSFPTGAGKSTLAELKIATAVIRGKKVVFLAPTLALVDQTTRAVHDAFPDVEVFRERTSDLRIDVGSQELPAVSVMTPERCLAFINFAPTLFEEVELVIFDECHLLHPRSVDKSRRAVDAMMCIINLFISAPNADFLFLSAMMKNCEEISSWIKELTGRPCLALDLLWKPTRQVRGCVVYSQAEITVLKDKLRSDRLLSDSKGAPQATKSAMKAEPFAFFSLNQTWNTANRVDYSLQKLLESSVSLAVGSYPPENEWDKHRWYLTPNGVKVSEKLAQEISKKGLKTIVFLQTIPWANSANNGVCNNLPGSNCTLTDLERANYNAAKDEMGDAAHLYISIDEDRNSLVSSSACHHGHLLVYERALHESLFRRKDGINVLVATSTISQGMNLPGDVVIIGGDKRFDLDSEQMSRLEAHELLNAAGRAGRAGDRSHGFVIVVPSKVVEFNNENSEIDSYWSELRGIFSQSDQCLTIEDPLEPLLDRIHETSSANEPMTEYLVARLPRQSDNIDDGEDKIYRLVSRSFAAYKKKQLEDNDWVQSRIDAVQNVRLAEERDAALEWQEEISAAIGYPANFIQDLVSALIESWDSRKSVMAWQDWYIEWLGEKPDRLPKLIRAETLESFLGTPYKQLNTNAARGEMIQTKVFPLLDLWMSGAVLKDIERAFGTAEHLLKTCERARDFVADIVPELSYLFGAPLLVAQTMVEELLIDDEVPLSLTLLSICVKEGLDSSEKAVLKSTMDGMPNRRLIHREFESLQNNLLPAEDIEDFNTMQARISLAKDSPIEH